MSSIEQGPHLRFETADTGREEALLLFDSFGMNPRTLRFYLLEKEIDLPRRDVNILAAENRQPEYLALNPAGQTPALSIEGNAVLSETPAIIEYLEELHPEPPLIGRTPAERAITRMWWRRIEINICHPMVQAFYFGEGLDIFKSRFRCLPEAAAGLKERARDGMRWLDGQLDGTWLAGDRFTVADICLYCYIDQLGEAGQPMPPECGSLHAWFGRVGARPAAEASIWKERPMGMRG